MTKLPELFSTRTDVEPFARKPIRPLGHFSDTVVLDLQSAMSDAEDLAASVHDASFTDARLHDIALLDALYLETAIVHTGGRAGEHLTALVDRLAAEAGRIPVPTYEDFMFINPAETDPRLFTTGDAAHTEIDFYLAHRVMEDHLARTINHLFAAIRSLREGNPNGLVAVVDHLREGNAQLDEVRIHMQHMGSKMNNDHFHAFRPFLNGHPARGYEGVSGGSSFRIPVIDILVGGSNIPDDYLRYIEEHFQYYPRVGIAQVTEALELRSVGGTLADFADRVDIIREPLRAVAHTMLKFRSAHYGAVAKQVPEVLAGNVVGTAGTEDVKGLLNRRRSIRHVQ